MHAHTHTAGEEDGEDYHQDEADPQGMMSARNSFIGHVPADHYMTHDQLKALAESMKHSVDIRDRRFHLTKYKKVHFRLLAHFCWLACALYLLACASLRACKAAYGRCIEHAASISSSTCS
jgi:hypothetical protein